MSTGIEHAIMDPSQSSDLRERAAGDALAGLVVMPECMSESRKAAEWAVENAGMLVAAMKGGAA
jgi:hypothetical protein